MPRKYTRLTDFIDRMRGTQGCWEWPGKRDPCGYGSVRSDGSWRGVHRVVYERLRGSIPQGLELDHLCRNPLCCNPDHLEPVTHAENVRRGAPATKTHCINGHEFTLENTYLRPSGQRDCRACIRERVRRYQKRCAA